MLVRSLTVARFGRAPGVTLVTPLGEPEQADAELASRPAPALRMLVG